MKLVCFHHPQYTGHQGQEAPTLSCKTCCTIFINAIKQQNSDSSPADERWLQRQNERNGRVAKGTHFGFSPEII